MRRFSIGRIEILSGVWFQDERGVPHIEQSHVAGRNRRRCVGRDCPAGLLSQEQGAQRASRYANYAGHADRHSYRGARRHPDAATFPVAEADRRAGANPGAASEAGAVADNKADTNDSARAAADVIRIDIPS
jgi:hypothetical protein